MFTLYLIKFNEQMTKKLIPLRQVQIDILNHLILWHYISVYNSNTIKNVLDTPLSQLENSLNIVYICWVYLSPMFIDRSLYFLILLKWVETLLVVLEE